MTDPEVDLAELHAQCAEALARSAEARANASVALGRAEVRMAHAGECLARAHARLIQSQQTMLGLRLPMVRRTDLSGSSSRAEQPVTA